MMSHPLQFSCESVQEDGTTLSRVLSIAPRQFVIAGWTGRDAAAIEHHIHELQLLGVPAPSTVPLYYRASAALLTQQADIEVLGAESSGEVEPVLFFADGQWWLTVGSDHTDRKVETYSVAVSKQMCPKPIAASAWRWQDVQARQDEIELHSRIFEDGQWVDYQRGTLASIRPLDSLRQGFFGTGPAPEGSFMCCGTLGALRNAQGQGIRPAPQMELRLFDPRRQRSIVHRYNNTVLPVVA